MWRRIALIPVWLLTRALIPFLPADHSFRRRDMSLNGWVRGGTDLSVQFGIAFWLSGIGAAIAITILVRKFL